MKYANIPVLTSAALLACALLPSPKARAAAEPGAVSAALDHAEVRIPYSELRRLWEAAHAPAPTAAPREELPPGRLFSARYRLDFSPEGATLEADFHAESFAGAWECLPLMGAGPAVAAVDPPDARLVVEGDQLCLLARERGPLDVKIRFVKQPAAPSGAAPLLKLVAAPSAVGSLEVKGLPADRTLKLADGTTQAVRDGAAVIALPAKGGEISLHLADAAREPKPEPPPPPPQPSEWSLQNEALVFEGEGELAYRVHAHAMALNGSALEAAFLLPPNARAIKVTSDDLDTARPVRTPEGALELRVRWKTRDVTERDLKISYALQQLPLAPEWELRGPSLPGEARTKTVFMVALPAGMEFRGLSLQGPVPASKLPRWIAEETKAEEFGAMSGTASAALQSRLLPRLETAEAIVTRGEYVSKMVSSGPVLTEATFQIEHAGAMRWSLALPDKGELLTCSVNGVPVRPVARDGGLMEIPLGRPVGAKAAGSTVSLAYTVAGAKLDLVKGQATLALPQTPIFINELLWSIEIPESYEFTDVDGNLDAAPANRQDKPNVVRRVKKLCRNERPIAEIFYRKRGPE